MPEKPRKSPKQRRSKATVDALLEATAQVLVSHGYQKATTNRIAERAGVSIGSLYEYYPNKDALVASLIEKHTYDVLHQLMSLMQKYISLPPDEALRVWLSAMVSVLNERAELLRVAINQIPYLNEISPIRRLREKLLILTAYGGGQVAKNFNRELSPEEVYLVMTMASTSIISMVVTPPENLDATVDTLADMLLKLLSTP